MNSKPDWIGGHGERSEIMDFMDIDQVVEVPDTPDRLLAACSSDGIKIQNVSDISKSYQVVNEPRQKGKSVTINGNRRLFVRPDNSSNSSGSLSKNIPPAVDNARHDKGKALCNSNIQKSSSFVDLTDQNGHKKCLFSANGLTAVDTSSKSCRLNGNLKIGEHKGEKNLSPSVTRQKRLVRNGCISPHNIAKSKQVVEKHGTSAMSSDGPSSRVAIKDLIAEAKESRRFKGKGVSHSHRPSSPDARSRHLSQRNSGILKEPTDASKDIESDGWRATNNPTRKPDLPLLDNDSRIFRGKGASSSAIDQQNRSTSSNLNNHFDDLEIVSSQRVSAPPETLSRRAHQLGQFKERAQLTKRQREGVASSNTGMPRFNDSEIVFLSPSSEEPSTSRPIRNKNHRGVGASNPVIALDESSADAGNHGLSTHHSSNEDSGVRALQLEADEILARELQEQLYNEELGIDEMDSHHALEMEMALLQENGSHAFRAGGRPAHRPAFRGASVSNLYQHSRSNPSRNPSVHRGGHAQAPPSTRLARLRGRFPGRPRTLSSTTMTRNSIFPPHMDVDMRMQILEALEAFNEMELPNDLLQAGREFNENDYEILLALDENNHQHGGATHAQINNLPESTVQAENFQECAICLETPSIGETIRHLPCLHRFHKDCIDEWLRRKTSCPVCKSSVI